MIFGVFESFDVILKYVCEYIKVSMYEGRNFCLLEIGILKIVVV